MDVAAVAPCALAETGGSAVADIERQEGDKDCLERGEVHACD